MPDNGEKKSRRTSESTVIFVDWDDTLLCSSYLSTQGLRLDTEMEPTHDIFRELKELESSVNSLLQLAKMYGEVHVVTNAETGWVQLSAKKFIPGVIPHLEGVNVLSARSSYESMFPNAPLKWKFYAFQERLMEVFAKSQTQKNIISFGDSHVEREAVRAVTRGLPNTRTKSVKFTEKPSMAQLRRQLELVTNCFQYIHSHDGDLDLQLTSSKAEQHAGLPSGFASVFHSFELGGVAAPVVASAASDDGVAEKQQESAPLSPSPASAAPVPPSPSASSPVSISEPISQAFSDDASEVFEESDHHAVRQDDAMEVDGGLQVMG